jgi:hypothetical protein
MNDMRKPGWFARTGFLFMGLAVLGLGLSALLKGHLLYQSYWGGAAFAPVVSLIGAGLLYIGIFRWERIQKREPPLRTKHHR